MDAKVGVRSRRHCSISSKENWKQFKDKVKEQWGELTDDDLDQIAGKRDQLEGKFRNVTASRSIGSAATSTIGTVAKIGIALRRDCFRCGSPRFKPQSFAATLPVKILPVACEFGLSNKAVADGADETARRYAGRSAMNGPSGFCPKLQSAVRLNSAVQLIAASLHKRNPMDVW